MTIAPSKSEIKRVSFADYLTHFDNHFDNSDTKYELVGGELIPMALGTGRHGEIIHRIYRAINSEIDRIGHGWISRQGQIGVRCPRGIGRDTSRIPDVVVMLKAEWLSLQEKEAVIDFDLSAPLLVVEVVSPSTKTTDYRAKRTEYAACGIPEYWIIDPLSQKISVLVLADGWYDVAEFQEKEAVISPTFPELKLTPTEIFS